jgi:hypothetical protein
MAGVRTSARLLVATAVAAAILGCAGKYRGIPVEPLTPRPLAAVERDHHECERAVTGAVKGAWLPGELEFAACMIARNYRAFVQVLDAATEVRKASPRSRVSQARVVDDLLACERAVAANVTLLEKIGRPTMVVAGLFFWPVAVGSATATTALPIRRLHDYAACMTPRGYLVTAWEPSPPPPPASTSSP